MDYKQYYAALSAGSLKNLLLFDGEEEYVKESALSALRKALLPEGLEAVNESRFADKTAPSALIDACETLPFLAEKRLVLVMDSPLCLPGRGEGEDKALLSYLDRLPDSCCLLFFVRGAADGKKALVKRIEAAAGHVRFEPLLPREQESFVRRQLRAYEKTIAPDALNCLLERSGPLLTNVNNQIQKIAAHAGENHEVQLADVEAVVPLGVDLQLFALLDAILLCDRKKALTLLTELQKEREAFSVLSASLARQLRSVYHTRLLLDDGQGRREIAQALGVTPWVAGKRMEMAARFPGDLCWRMLQLCTDLVYEVRSGQRAEDGALFLLVFEMLRLAENGAA